MKTATDECFHTVYLPMAGNADDFMLTDELYQFMASNFGTRWGYSFGDPRMLRIQMYHKNEDAAAMLKLKYG